MTRMAGTIQLHREMSLGTEKIDHDRRLEPAGETSIHPACDRVNAAKGVSHVAWQFFLDVELVE